jgi:hypothetical protein
LKLSYKKMSELELNTALAAAQLETTHRGRAQAMAWIARNVRSQRHVASTAQTAAEAAHQEEDLYRAVCALAWPIRALLERDEPRLAAKLLADAMSKSVSVTPAASQSEALFLLMQAAMFGTDRMWERPFQNLLASSFPIVNWRQGRNVRDAICMVASFDYAQAKQAANELPDEKLKAAILDLLANNKKQPPRPFFW